MKKLWLATLVCTLPAWALEINTATTDQIASLKGMNPQIAAAIVAARTQTGSFKTSSDLLKVPGVTQGMLNRNRATLTINGKPVTTRSGTAPAIPGTRPALPAKKAATTPTQDEPGQKGKSSRDKSDAANKGGNSSDKKGGNAEGKK